MPAGYKINGNACPHQAAVALKYGISHLNFIPQTAKERFNIAIVAAGNNTKFNVSQFVSLHQKEIESDPHFFGDQEEMDEEPQVKIPTSTSLDSPRRHSTTNAAIPAVFLGDEEISLDHVIKLHKEVSQDIEHRLRTSDKNYCKCVFVQNNNYLCPYVGAKQLSLHLPVPMLNLERTEVEIPCQFFTMLPELRYNQHLLQEEKQTLNLPVHKQVVVVLNFQTAKEKQV